MVLPRVAASSCALSKVIVESTARRQPIVAGPRRRVLTGKAMDAETKLRNIIEEYRQVHFTQEIPTRFKKEVAKAAANAGKFRDDLQIDPLGLERVVLNVGGHGRMPSCEIMTIFNLHGDKKSGHLTGRQLVQIL